MISLGDIEIDVENLYKYLPKSGDDDVGSISGIRYLSDSIDDEDLIPDEKVPDITPREVPKGKGKAKGTTCFPHQVTIKIKTEKNSPKMRVFSNKIAVVGCKDESSIGFICDTLKAYILWAERYHGVKIFVTKPYLSVSYRVNMSNYSFNLGFLIDRQSLCELIEKHGDFRAMYNPSYYPAVMIKRPCRSNPSKWNSITVFHTGNCLFSRKQDKNEAREVYYLFINFINSVRDQIELMPRQKNRKRTRSP